MHQNKHLIRRCSPEILQIAHFRFFISKWIFNLNAITTTQVAIYFISYKLVFRIPIQSRINTITTRSHSKIKTSNPSEKSQNLARNKSFMAQETTVWTYIKIKTIRPYINRVSQGNKKRVKIIELEMQEIQQSDQWLPFFPIPQRNHK